MRIFSLSIITRDVGQSFKCVTLKLGTLWGKRKFCNLPLGLQIQIISLAKIFQLPNKIIMHGPYDRNNVTLGILSYIRKYTYVVRAHVPICLPVLRGKNQINFLYSHKIILKTIEINKLLLHNMDKSNSYKVGWKHKYNYSS